METKVLEINLVSAQGLKTPSNNIRRRVQTYAIAWVDPSSKLPTRIDSLGGQNPTWNDKFLFRVSNNFVSGDTSAVSVEIYAVGFVTDVLIGTVRFLLSTCRFETVNSTPSFTAVQVRRPSGRFQGMLNIATAVYDLCDFVIMEKASAVCLRDVMVDKKGSGWKLRSKRSESLEKSNSFCGLMMMQRMMMIPFCPSDPNLHSWADDSSDDDDDN